MENILKKTLSPSVALFFFIIVFLYGDISADKDTIQIKSVIVKDYEEKSMWVAHVSGGMAAGLLVRSDKKSFSNGPSKGKKIAPLLNVGFEYAKIYDRKFAMVGSIQTDLYYGYRPVVMPGIGVYLSSDDMKKKAVHILKIVGHFPFFYLNEFWTGYGWSLGYDYTLNSCIAIGVKVQAISLFSIKNESSFEMAFHSVYDTLAGVTFRF